MIDFITNAFGSIASWIKNGAESVKNVFISLWHTVENLGTNVFHAWEVMYHGISAVISGIIDLGLEAFRTVWWLFTKYIPQQVAHVFDKVGQLLSHLFDVVKAWVSDFVQAVKAGIVAIINTVKQWASDLFDWVKGILSDIWTLLHKTADLVWNLLGDLDHLVAAIVGRMVQAIFKYLENHAKQYAEWGIRHFVQASLGVADWIESIIADVL